MHPTRFQLKIINEQPLGKGSEVCTSASSAANGCRLHLADIDLLPGQCCKPGWSLVCFLQEIPTAASLIDSFNREALYNNLQRYISNMDGLKLPLEESALAAADASARQRALEAFDEGLLGRSSHGLRGSLVAAIDREKGLKVMANSAASNDACQVFEMQCVRLLDSLTAMTVPVLHKFDGMHRSCQTEFDANCVGPAKATSQERLDLAWRRARAQFSHEYNEKLFNGLLVVSLIIVVVFRFVVKWRVVEACGWGSFVFLMVWPKLHPGASIYDSSWWQTTAAIWEAVMYILVVAPGSPLIWAILAAAVMYVRRRRRLKRGKQQVFNGSDRDLEV